jgi:tryptophan-rich sensory protein
MTQPMSMSNSPAYRFLALGGWLLLCFAAASLGALFGPGEWYAALKKPSWNPPAWLFGPVWKRGGFAAQRKPLIIFLAQLALNAAWTPLFFGLHSPGLAFAEMVLLWSAIVATIVVFRPVSRAAMLLLVPYLGWVSFAAVLNFSLWRLNV